MSAPEMLPAPPAGRLAVYLPGDAGRNSAVVIHLDGWHQIFRFTVNMLHHQLDFATAARGVLVEMRDHMTPARFDPMARTLLGEDWYAKVRNQFERSWGCVGCEKEIRVGWKYAPLDDAGALCAACCRGFPEYTARMVKRAATNAEVTS